MPTVGLVNIQQDGWNAAVRALRTHLASASNEPLVLDLGQAQLHFGDDQVTLEFSPDVRWTKAPELSRTAFGIPSNAPWASERDAAGRAVQANYRDVPSILKELERFAEDANIEHFLLFFHDGLRLHLWKEGGHFHYTVTDAPMRM